MIRGAPTSTSSSFALNSLGGVVLKVPEKSKNMMQTAVLGMSRREYTCYSKSNIVSSTSTWGCMQSAEGLVISTGTLWWCRLRLKRCWSNPHSWLAQALSMAVGGGGSVGRVCCIDCGGCQNGGKTKWNKMQQYAYMTCLNSFELDSCWDFGTKHFFFYIGT